MSKCRILRSNLTPQTPAAAGTHFRTFYRCLILVAVDRSLSTASVRNKDKIILSQRDFLLLAALHVLDCLRNLFLTLDVKPHIRNLSAKLDLDACRLQIFLHRQNQRLILVVTRKFECREIRKSADVVDKTLKIAFHL